MSLRHLQIAMIVPVISFGCIRTPPHIQTVIEESDLRALHILLSNFADSDRSSGKTVQIDRVLSEEIKLGNYRGDVSFENFTADRLSIAQEKSRFYSGSDWLDVLRGGREDFIFGVYISSVTEPKQVCFLIAPNGKVMQILIEQARLDSIIEGLKDGQQIPFKKEP